MHVKSKKIKTMILSIALLLSFTSCENFLKATDVKDEIENMIAYANAQSYEIRVECDEGTGSIIGNAILKQKETDTFTVEFKIASGYYFTGWKVFSKNQDGTTTELSEGYIKLDAVDPQNNDGVYKAKITFVKATPNITIKAQCVQIPVVTSYSPAAGTQPFAFTPIVINFSKPIESYDDISLLVGTMPVEDCFKDPVLNEAKTTITIQPIYEKLSAFMQDRNAAYIDVNVSLGTGITAQTGDITLPIAQDSNSNFIVSYKYGKETEPPVLSDFLAAREEISDPSELPDLLRFSLKAYSGYGTFDQNDITRNFVYNGKFYIWGKAYDEGTGVSRVTVSRKRTHLAESTNDEINDNEKTTTYTAQSSDATFIDDGNGNTYFCIKYELEETGIYLFNVKVQDYCENPVSATPFSVIYKTNYFEELDNAFALGNVYSDIKLLRVFFLGPGKGLDDEIAGTKICNIKLYLQNYAFYCTYTDDDNEPRFEKFTEGYVSEYVNWPAHHLDVSSVDGLPFILNLVAEVEGKTVILGTRNYTFPRKPIFEKIDGNSFYFTAPENGEENTSCGTWSFNTSNPDQLYYAYAKNTYNFVEYMHSGARNHKSLDLYGEKVGPYTKDQLLAMQNGEAVTQDLQINDNSISIAKSQKAEYLDVTVALDPNWKDNYDSITLRCNYSTPQSEDQAAQMKNWVNYTSIQEGNSITLSLPTKIFLWYPKSFYTNAKDITLTLEGTKDGVSQYSSPKIISISDQDKQLYDNIPPYDCKLLGSQNNGMIITFTDKESGVKSGKISFNGKEYTMSASTREGASGYYDALIPFDDFSFGKNRFTVYMEDNAGVKLFKEFLLIYKTKLVAEDGVDQSVTGKWKPNLQNQYIYWALEPVFNSARFLQLNQGTIEIHEYDCSSQAWQSNPKTLIPDGSNFPNSSTYTIDCSTTDKFVKCQIISDQYWDNSNTDIWCNYEIYYTGSNKYKGEGKGEYNMLNPNGTFNTSMIVKSDAPVFIHTLATNHSYDEVKDYTVAQWESHARELGTKQINFSADDHEERRYNIPSNLLQKGECYIVIAHFADDTVLTSKVMVW